MIPTCGNDCHCEERVPERRGNLGQTPRQGPFVPVSRILYTEC